MAKEHAGGGTRTRPAIDTTRARARALCLRGARCESSDVAMCWRANEAPATTQFFKNSSYAETTRDP